MEILDQLKARPDARAEQVPFLCMLHGWWLDPAVAPLLDETVRTTGCLLYSISGADVMKPGDKLLAYAVEAASRGVEVWIKIDSLGDLGQGLGMNTRPEYWHTTIEALDDPYPRAPFDGPIWRGCYKPDPTFMARHAACPGRSALQPQAADWFRIGRKLRDLGLDWRQLAGIYDNCELLHVADRAEWYLDRSAYDRCESCGSWAAHDDLLARARRETVAALRDGLGDYGQTLPLIGWDLSMHFDVNGWPAMTTWVDLTNPLAPWIAQPCFANYGTRPTAVTDLDRRARLNQTVAAGAGLRSSGPAVWLGLTYNSDARADGNIPAGLNRQKAETVAAYPDSMLLGYALKRWDADGNSDLWSLMWRSVTEILEAIQ